MIGLGEAGGAGLKSFMDHQQLVKYKSTTIKTLLPAHTMTYSKDRWIGAYSSGKHIIYWLD